MYGSTIAILVALIVQLALGLVVFQSNWHRKSNQSFLLLSFAASGWLVSLYFAFTANSSGTAAIAIREASSSSLLILASLNLLRIALRRRQETWNQILHRARIWIAATIVMIGLCQTRFFLEGARVAGSRGTAAATPVYGTVGGWVFAIYFGAATAFLIFTAVRDLGKTAGSQHAEISFVLLGGISVVVLPLLLAFLLDVLIGPSKALWFAPFRIILFSAIVAYGISTRKIMEVGVLLRRIISYTLLGAYLLALYALVWWLVSMALPSSSANAHSIAHIAAAIVIAFAMAPARGVSQRLAERLFISAQRLDFRATVSNAAAILKSVTTLRDLLERFAQTIAQAANTERVVILLAQKDSYTQYYPAPTRQSQIELPKDHPLLNYLKSSGQPIVLDELHRIRPTAEVHRIINQMQHLDLAVVMGIFARDQLEGVMLLGPRISGHIYGSIEQEALQVLCGQLAVAIENAQLFTEVQNARIYNETLLENLTTGVIAVGADERVTVFNNEAEQITGLNSGVVLDRPLAELPESLGRVLRETLQTGQGRVNHEVDLGSDSKEMIARTSTSIFHDQDQQMLGALMVLTDITVLKQLEAQIRRSDRLASLGTLSAGMAHEIKNPLVSIKTFAQLLPERYQDSDFRETFSNLIGHEIDRIDSLVNQLLRFARPTKPLLKPVHVHEVLEKSLNLLGHRLYQKEIKLARSLQANVDTIRADADQLEQVFLNFFLNAMDAMKKGGELAVTTQVQTDERWIAAITRSNGESGEVLHITIRDTGEGIRKEDIPHVFDPFFTTKDYGTGLGLSVVHGIIQEHGGQIEVESEVQKGTAFHILLPLARFDSKVAVA